MSEREFVDLVIGIVAGTFTGGLLGLLAHDLLCPKHGKWRRRVH